MKPSLLGKPFERRFVCAGGLVFGLLLLVCLVVGCSKSEPCNPPPVVDAAASPRTEAGVVPVLGPRSVLQESLHANRDAAFVEPTFTKSVAQSLHVQKNFTGQFDGTSYALPLYLDGLRSGQDALIVASWSNQVTALDATTGAAIWEKTLGAVYPPASLACNQPSSQNYGIIATPIVDPATRTLYVESFETACGNHFVYALSIDDGSTKPGWPVDVGAALAGFVPTLQHARAGLALLAGYVYVAFSGILFDCEQYNGWVVGISTTDPTEIHSFSTTAPQGGIWGGVATNGTTLFFSTGNSVAGQPTWGRQEAVFALPPSLAYSGDPKTYFTPSNWSYLDSNDFDLGSATVLPFDLPGATPSSIVAAVGKGGVLYLLDQNNLGGLGKGNGETGEGLYSAPVSTTMDGVKGRLTSYVTSKGRYVVMRTDGKGAGCPKPGDFNVVAARLTASSPPKFSVAWCANAAGYGSPISTTTDGTNNAIVWIVGARRSNRLYGLDGDTGEVVYAGGDDDDVVSGAWLYTAPVVAKGRLFVAGAGKLYSFAPVP